jgi:hypothetical protein
MLFSKFRIQISCFNRTFILCVIPYCSYTNSVYIIQVSEKECAKYTHFIEKTNRARRLQFSPHERATQKVFPPSFSISLLLDLSSLCCSHNCYPVFKFPERVVVTFRRDSFHVIYDTFGT